MSDSNFEHCLEFVLGAEGGFSNNKFDNGGPTNYGITAGELESFRRRFPHLNMPLDVRKLDSGLARTIYHTDYWAPSGGIWATPGLDLVLFNAGVMSGPSRAIRLLQQALHIKVDGQAGPFTQDQVKMGNRRQIALNTNAQHLAYMKTLPDWPHFGHGWANRNTRVASEAVRMAAAL